MRETLLESHDKYGERTEAKNAAPECAMGSYFTTTLMRAVSLASNLKIIPPKQ